MQTIETMAKSHHPSSAVRVGPWIALAALLAATYFASAQDAADEAPSAAATKQGAKSASPADDPPAADDAAATDGRTKPKGAQRIREDSKFVDRVGNFKLSGDRATFYAADGLRLTGLENLNLERIVRAITDNPNQQWKVTGTVTEYRGANFLLVTHAIALNKPSSAGKSP